MSIACQKSFQIIVHSADTCGLSLAVVHCPAAYAFYLACGGTDFGPDLNKIVVGPNTFYVASDQPPPLTTLGITISLSVNKLFIQVPPAGTINVVYSKDIANGCPLGSYTFSVEAGGPPPPPPAIPGSFTVVP